METKEEKQERWNRYNLNVGDTVFVKCEVVKIEPNCVVKLKPWGNSKDEEVFYAHRNMIVDILD